MADTHPQEPKTPVGGPAHPDTVSDDVSVALDRLLSLYDKYDPGPNQDIRDAVDWARAVMAKANAKKAAHK